MARRKTAVDGLSLKTIFINKIKLMSNIIPFTK
jgi:hypothetical protein